MSLSTVDSLAFLDITDELPRRAAAKSLAAAVSRSHGVRAFPVAVQKLLQATSDKAFKVEEVTATIESDSSLAVRILRVVNSPAFGLRMRCHKIRMAVTLLGPKRLSEIAIAAAALEWFDDDSPAVRGIFVHSMGTATLARAIAQRVGLAADEMYTCGLLHDFGKLMMLQSEDERYPAMLAETAGIPDLAHVRETEAYGFDHALLGAIMLAGWHIPDPVPNVVGWHHQPDRAFAKGGAVGKMVATLRFAERLAHEFETGAIVNGAWLSEIQTDPSVAHLGLVPGDAFAKLCQELQKKHADSQKTSLLEDSADLTDDYEDGDSQGGKDSMPEAPSASGKNAAADEAPKADPQGEEHPGKAEAADGGSPDKVPEAASPEPDEPESPRGPRPILPVRLPGSSARPPAAGASPGASLPKRPLVPARGRRVSPAGIVAVSFLFAAAILRATLPQLATIAVLMWCVAFVALFVVWMVRRKVAAA